MKPILNLRKPHIARMIIISVVCGFVGIILYYLTPFFTGYLIDSIISLKKLEFVYLWLVAGIVFGVVLHSYLFYFLKFIWDKYAFLLSNEVRYQLGDQTHALKPYQFEQFNHGFIFNLFFSDAATVGGVTLTYIGSSILAVLRIITCTFINLKLTLISLCFIPLYIITMYMNRHKLEKASVAERKALDSCVFFVRKMIEGKVHINLFKKEEYFQRTFHQYMDGWTKWKLGYSFWFNLTKEIPQFVSTVAPFVVLAFGASLVIRERLTLGSLIMFSQYVAMLFEPLNIVSQAFVEKKATAPIFERVSQFFTPQRGKQGITTNTFYSTESSICFD